MIPVSLAILSLTLPPARAGYGDGADGHRSHAELQFLLWANAVRLDPTRFQTDYEEGGCVYSEDFDPEDRAELPPTLLLTSADSEAEAPAGTSFAEAALSCGQTVCATDGATVGRTEDQDIERLVKRTLMCDPTARASLRVEGDVALGVALLDEDALTSDSGGTPDTAFTSSTLLFSFASASTAGLGAHDPLLLGYCDSDGTCRAVWEDDDAPARILATNGVDSVILWSEDPPSSVSNLAGSTRAGIYQGTTDARGDAVNLDCDTPYWFVWETADGQQGTFPEEGALNVERCDAAWVARPVPRGWFCGVPLAAAGLPALLGLLGALRRRQRRA